jgi:hypothetical protein
MGLNHPSRLWKLRFPPAWWVGDTAHHATFEHLDKLVYYAPIFRAAFV